MTKAKEIEREVIENIEMEALVSRLRVKGRIKVDDNTYNKLYNYIKLNHRDLIDNKLLFPYPNDEFNIVVELNNK